MTNTGVNHAMIRIASPIDGCRIHQYTPDISYQYKFQRRQLYDPDLLLHGLKPI